MELVSFQFTLTVVLKGPACKEVTGMECDITYLCSFMMVKLLKKEVKP